MDKGAFISLSEDKKSIELFIFMRVTQQELQTALPLENPESFKNHNMLCCVFVNGVDYLGSGTEEEVRSIIFKPNMEMIDLLNNSYEEICRKGLPHLNLEIYKNIYNFAIKQLSL